jgi:hypothetical protein
MVTAIAERPEGCDNLSIFCDFDKKVKNVKFSLEQAMKALRGSRGIAVLFLQPRR